MRLFGLIGYPLSHSFSKGYFSEKFSKEHIENCKYENFPIENISKLTEVIAKNPELRGLNITIPYKEQVLSFLDEVSPEAKEIGAVNTIRFIRDGNNRKLKGYNTDMFGFMESIKPLIQEHHNSALVLGTGGASKAVKYALKTLGIHITSVSRHKSSGSLAYQDLTEEIFRQHKIIVNTTPLGTYPKVEEYPPLPYVYLTPDHLLYDLVYNPSITAFLNFGWEHNCTIKNGLEMLHLQAEKAWQIWNSNE